MINERGLLRAMKNAYRGAGYEVAGYGEENTLFINGYSWCVAVPQKQCPRKVLALLVEHVGLIPAGDAFRVQKGEGAQVILQSVALSPKNRLKRLLGEEHPVEIRKTAMTWKGWRIWQKTESGVVMAFDSGLTAIGLGEPETYGNFLVWDDGDEVVWVMPCNDVLDLEFRELLEKTELAAERQECDE